MPGTEQPARHLAEGLLERRPNPRRRGGDTELGEGHEPPVGPAPFLVGVDTAATRRPVSILAFEEGRHPRVVGQRGVKRDKLGVVCRAADQVPQGQPADGRMGVIEEPGDRVGRPLVVIGSVAIRRWCR
jgi:hypothetical protein